MAADYVGTEKHIYRLTEADITELDAAVAAVQASGIEIKVITPPKDFSTTQGRFLLAWRHGTFSSLDNLYWLSLSY
jgi:hypothetical protein